MTNFIIFLAAPAVQSWLGRVALRPSWLDRLGREGGPGLGQPRASTVHRPGFSDSIFLFLFSSKS